LVVKRGIPKAVRCLGLRQHGETMYCFAGPFNPDTLYRETEGQGQRGDVAIEDGLP
jgi:hypothetical protein